MKRRSSFRRLAMATVLFIGAWLVPSSVSALPGDGSDPTSCSGTNVRTVGISNGSGVTVGQTQLRYSLGCQRVWSRVCASSGYQPGERAIRRTAPDFYSNGTLAGASTTACTGFVGSRYSRAARSDCYAAWGYFCHYNAYGDVRTSGGVLVGQGTTTSYAT